MQPDAKGACDDECLELMEMILGALGRDAVGLGSRWVGVGVGGAGGGAGGCLIYLFIMYFFYLPLV